MSLWRDLVKDLKAALEGGELLRWACGFLTKPVKPLKGGSVEQGGWWRLGVERVKSPHKVGIGTPTG